MAGQEASTLEYRTHRFETCCSACAHRHLCLPADLDEQGMERLGHHARASIVLAPGERLVRQGQAMRGLFAVRSGSLKGVRSQTGGHEQVLAFYMTGDLLGLDAIDSGRYQCSVEALETTTLCSFSADTLETLSAQEPRLQHQLLRIASREMVALFDRDPEQSAERRMAGFLLGISDRMKNRGWSGRSFQLSMPRRDVASYLSMAPETASRVLRRMCEDRLIRIDRRLVELLDFDGLEKLREDAI